MSNNASLTRSERKAAFSLAGIFAFRMIGLFMLLPVMATYGQALNGYSPQTVGLAIGVYGLVQGVLMIPLGKLSDRYGRKPVMLVGLTVFAIGAVVAALSTHIYGVIAGRALQGAGAIAGVVLALAADLTAEHRRSKVMAIIGMSIGASFLLAFGLGPMVAARGGLNAIFWLTCALALGGVALTLWGVPREPQHLAKSNQSWVQLFTLLKDSDLSRLSWGIFVLHAIMAATFVVLPLHLLDAGIEKAKHGSVYLPVMVLSALFMMPLLRVAERQHRQKPFLLAMIGVLLITVVVTLAAPSLALIAIALCGFFVAFNFLEASLPSWVSRIVPPAAKGTAMGFYTSAQFFGAFVGGAGGGYAFAQGGAVAVSWCVVAMCLVWLLAAVGQKPLSRIEQVTLALPDDAFADAVTRLQALEGVIEIVELPQQAALQVTFDAGQIQAAELTEKVSGAPRS